MSRTGRRPGATATRRVILDEARRAFAARGYRATTFRAVAEAAGVDPALITHYFGSKEGLFAAAAEIPVLPSQLFSGLDGKDTAAAAEFIVREYLTMIDGPRTREAILALVRSAVSDEQAATLLREFLTEELLPLLRRVSRHQDARLRSCLVAAQLIGIAMLRHVLRLEPLAQSSTDEIVARVTPVVELYLR